MLVDRWYAAYTRPRHEKAVVEYLRYQEVENFLPLYRSMHRWRNRTTQAVDSPLFPSYVFVKMDRQRHSKVLSVPGVINLIGVPGQPIPILDREIDMLRIGCSQLNAEPHPFLKIGMRVLVRSGPLVGREGILIQKKQGCRLVLSMDIIMKSMSVEVAASDVEPIQDLDPALHPRPNGSICLVTHQLLS